MPGKEVFTEIDRHCEKCGKMFYVRIRDAANPVQCPNCGAMVTVPPERIAAEQAVDAFNERIKDTDPYFFGKGQ